jgi:hypothetical protein
MIYPILSEERCKARLTMKIYWLPTIQMMLLVPSLTIFPLCVWSQTPVVSTNEVVARMQAAKASYSSRSIPYTVIRHYVLSDNNPRTPDHAITAEVTVTPPAGLDYALATPPARWLSREGRSRSSRS